MARKHKIQKALTHLVQAIIRFAQKLTSRNTYRFLRTAFVTSRRRLQAGFVLPTTTLLIIVMMLVVSTLIFRSYQRSVDVVGQYQEQQVRNAATPAIERAKAKLELLFSDQPGGVYTQTAGIPPETTLEDLLATNNSYKFPDEDRLTLDLPGNITAKTAWSFETDSDGNGVNDTTTAYAIVLRSSRPDGEGFKTMNPRLADADSDLYTLLNSDKDKADYLVVRNGPIVITQSDSQSCKPRFSSEEGGAGNEFVQGWFQVGGSDALLMKNFQVYAISVPNSVITGNAVKPVISTVQYQQDRNFQRANKWGAWFRTDIEINPGGGFDWNGAIHSEGSLFISGQGAFLGKLISDPVSCFFNPKSNSDVTLWGHLVRSLLTRDTTTDSKFKGTVSFDIQGESVTRETVTKDTDSTNAGSPFQLSLKPQPILLLNQSEAQNPNLKDNSKHSDWDSGKVKERVQILQDSQAPPYIDDTYRADNRYGPKPGYGKAEADANGDLIVEPACDMGDPIIDGDQCFSDIMASSWWNPDWTIDDLIGDKPPDTDLEPDSYGLDGYWERRAGGQGLRVMVGQRLELGNAFGWKNADDPLYPQEDSWTPTNAALSNRKHELRQRRTQRDNLAAVQSTLVYHKDYGDPETAAVVTEPAAVIATTVHPGTEQTLKNSATFETIMFAKKTGNNNKAFENLDTTTGIIGVDFFNGYGTNGWEFAPPDITKEEVKTALTNLANFAGDLDGAYPPKQEAGKVHPLPYLTMWGNFSNLRRALTDDSSVADKTTKQTAAATLGLLAYNINYLQAYNYADANRTTGLDNVNAPANAAGLNALAFELWQLQNGNENRSAPTFDYEVIPITSPAPIASAYNLPPEAYIAKLEEKRNALKVQNRPADEIKRMDSIVKLARLVMTKEQVERDRTNGFNPSAANVLANNLDFTVPNTSGVNFIVNTTLTSPVPIACNVSLTATGGNNYFGLPAVPTTTTISVTPAPAPTDPFTEQKYVVGLSRLCSNQPKFPSLYYIFPTVNHDHDGDVDHQQPDTEPYIAKVTNGFEYKLLTNDAISKIAIQPLKIDKWVLLPQSGVTATDATAAPNDSKQELIKFDNANYKVAIKDSALFDGREEMSVRVLNLDMDMLRSKHTPVGKKETWLPYTGIVYAFREDAVREDAIARPSPSLTSTMNAFPPSDPRLKPEDMMMSIKPVDYYADPDRRPHGFRLKNGKDLRRKPGGTTVDTSILRGMTLVSDNPIYIQGDFNLHTSNGTNELKEIVDGDVNASFADPKIDYWRPTEILGDAITIISDNFCDGSIEDGLLFTANTGISIPNKTKYGCPVNNTQTSYINQNRPRTALPTTPQTFWQRENPYEDPDPATQPKSPILISRNAEPMTIDTAGDVTPYSGTYWSFADRSIPSTAVKFAQDNISDARNTKVNIVMINGVVPPQENQGNGGLVNFPRMLEDWVSGGDKTLSIRGSFMQLNFSNYATAPFDRDAWEPGDTSSTADRFFHYLRPARDWGYDVGLQYLPAGPVLRRMVIPGTERSEFYREPRADDPYICKLREAIGFKCTN